VLPPLLADRPRPLQIVLAGVVPAVFGAICGWVLGWSELLYLLLAVPVATLGGFGAGLEHRGAASGARRGFVGGLLFGSFLLIVHELTGEEAEAELPDPPVLLAVATTVLGTSLGALAGWLRARRERHAGRT
jgi:membrane protein YqaA with SNARE-associated domain